MGIILLRTAILLLLSSILLSCGHAPIHIHTPNRLPEPKPLPSLNIALVLGGGGARGVAHAGVISVLEEHHIPIDLVVGTSIGSVIGALYADKPDAQSLKNRVLNIKKWELLDPNIQSGLKMFWGIGGLLDGHGLRAYLQNNLTAKNFNSLKIPLVAVTTDIEKGEMLIIRSGPIIPAIHASSAVPLVFTPVHIYNRILVDGGVISPVPVEVAKNLGARKIIAVDLGAVVKPRQVTGTMQMLDRCFWLSYAALTRWQTHHSDVLIQPEFDSTSMFDDSKVEEYFESGRQAALKALPQIKALLADLD